MDRSFRSGVLLFVGIAVFLGALVWRGVQAEPGTASWIVAAVGLAMVAAGAFGLREELAGFFQRRRGEIALSTVGILGILVALAWLSLRFTWRADMTEQGAFSLSPQTVTMLERLERPVEVTFFHDPMMRETVELYELMASKTPKLQVRFFDPTLNPAQARLMGVQFPGTAVLQSESRKLVINSPAEADIANGILRVSRATTQTICFTDGHGEPDPFSMESHDHMEGDAGHSHGLGGSKMVVHEAHGMAKARLALESMNYVAEKVALTRAGTSLDKCAVLVVAGPKSALLPAEVEKVRDYVRSSGNALFMLDPFVQSGLEPVLREIGIVLDDNIVIDEASHFWADPSAPAVTDYNRHQITRDLPLTFFPGARSMGPTEQRVARTTGMPLVNTSKSSYGETSRDKPEYDEGKDMKGPLTLVAAVTRRLDAQDLEDDETPPPAVAGKVQGESAAADATPAGKKRKSRIIVVGDSDFATNSFFHIMGNGNLFLNTVNFLAAQENLIGVEPKTFDTPRVNLTNQQMKATFILSVLVVPARLALVGTVVWWRQR